MSRLLPGNALLLAALLAAATAHAQTERSGGGESQKIMQQYQQLAAERTALKSQLADMKKDLDTAQAELAGRRRSGDGLKGQAAGSAAQLRSRAPRKNRPRKAWSSQQRTSELIAKFRETATASRTARRTGTGCRASSRSATRRSTGARPRTCRCTRSMAKCWIAMNTSASLPKVGAADPFVRITHVRIENLVDEYRARAALLKVKKPQ